MKTKRELIIETVLDVIKILAALAIVSLAVLCLWGNVFREARKKAAPSPGVPMETPQPVSVQPMACTVEMPQEPEEEDEPGNVPAQVRDTEPIGECCLYDDGSTWIPFEYHEEIPLSEALQCILWDDCQEYGVDYYVALGLIQTESNFKTDADNGTHYGLCQLSKKYFPNNLPPGENIGEGMAFLGKLLHTYSGDVGAALCAYNSGHDTGSRRYANLVLERANEWEQALKT